MMPECRRVKVGIANYRINSRFFQRFKACIAGVDDKKGFKHVRHQFRMRHDQGANCAMAMDGAGSGPTHTRTRQTTESAPLGATGSAHRRDPRLDFVGKGAADLAMANLADLIAHRLPELRTLFGLAQIVLLA